MENITVELLTLEEINIEETRKLTAPIVFLFIFMVVGISGNLLVLILYRKTYSKSVYKIIIWNLALIYFVFCTLTIPSNIGRLIRYYTFTVLCVCKLFTTIIVFLSTYSSNLLVTFAIHRFRPVCTPLKKQITAINVKYWIIGGFLEAVLIAIPHALLQPIESEQFLNNITGHVCVVSFHSSIYTKMYNGFFLFVSVSYAVILFILYILIGRKLYLQQKFNESKEHFLSHSAEISSKVTKIAVTVSAVFVLCPCVCSQSHFLSINQSEISIPAFAALKIFERSYVINHVVNPFIYAFYNSSFRGKVKILFMSCCCKLSLGSNKELSLGSNKDAKVTKRSEGANSVELKG